MHLCWSMWKNCLVLRHLGWMFCSKSEEKLKCRWSDDWFAPKHYPQMKTKHMSKENRPSWVAQWKLTSWLTGLWHFCHCCAFSAFWSGPRPFCNCIWYMRFVTLIATVFCKVLFTTYFFSNFDCQWAFSPIVLANYCLTEHKWSGFPDLLSVQSILANNQFRSLEIVNFVNFVLSFALRKSFANHGRPRTEGKNWVYSSNKVQ